LGRLAVKAMLELQAIVVSLDLRVDQVNKDYLEQKARMEKGVLLVSLESLERWAHLDWLASLDLVA